MSSRFEASSLKVTILVTFYFLENYNLFMKISPTQIATIKGCPYKGICHDSETALVYNYVFLLFNESFNSIYDTGRDGVQASIISTLIARSSMIVLTIFSVFVLGRSIWTTPKQVYRRLNYTREPRAKMWKSLLPSRVSTTMISCYLLCKNR